MQMYKLTLLFNPQPRLSGANNVSLKEAPEAWQLTTLPDFFIGAHAVDSQLALLTRDPKRIRTYFPDVVLIAP
jgi:predicted nucleic acid-binding protein